MTTTTERIANAIKPIIEEDRRADRERIAELERDLAHARTAQHAAVTERDRLQAFVDSLNAKLDEAHKENARLVMENVRLVDSLAMGNPYGAGMPAPVVEEQGPWVIQDQDPAPTNDLPWAGVSPGGRFRWDYLEDLKPFETRAAAEQQMKATPSRYGSLRVITLAEARAIEAKRG